MINLLRSGVFMLLLLSGCGWNGTPTRHNDFIPLTSIEIVADSPAIALTKTIAAHTSTKLSVTGNYSGMFTRDITDQVVWSSDKPIVADFKYNISPDKNRVTGIAPGTAVLTATVGGVSSTFSLTVSSATISTMTITPVNPSIPKGLTTQFSVSGKFSDDTTQDLSFDATWSPTSGTFASVSDDPASKGLATTSAIGTEKITATFLGKSDTTDLTVTEPLLKSIALSTDKPSFLTLSARSFTATGTYSDGSTKDITSQVTWNSSNTTFATITSGGVATTHSQGTTTISAALNGVSGTTNLKATGGNLTAIDLSVDKVIPVNGNVTRVKDTVGRITAIGTFNNGAKRDITGVIAWKEADATIAKVTIIQGGNLAWLNALAVTGATAITATVGTLSNTTNITVTAPIVVVNGLTILPAGLDLNAGTRSPLIVTATFNDGSKQDVTASATWTSSNAAIASVGSDDTDPYNKGRVSGVAAGSTSITAAYGGVTAISPAPVTVSNRILQSLTITRADTTPVVSGTLIKYSATASYINGSQIVNQDVTENAAWTIDKPYVAILADSQSQPGQVVAVDSGSATLTAAFDGKTATTTVTVP